MDAELYLPESWTKDRARCREAGIPKNVVFQTKPQLARRMLERAQEADGPVEWVLADEVYGKSQELRCWLEEQRQSYVLAVSCNLGVRLAGQEPKAARRVDEVVGGLPAEAWQCLSAGEGSKGPRLYDWVWRETDSSDLPSEWKRFLLARRSLEDPTEIAYYFVFAPAAVTVQEAVEAAGLRWNIESGFEQAKQEGPLRNCITRGRFLRLTSPGIVEIGRRTIKQRASGDLLPGARSRWALSIDLTADTRARGSGGVE